MAQDTQITGNSSHERRLITLEQRVDALEAHNKKSWMFHEKRWKRSIGVFVNALFFPLLLAVIGLIFAGLSSLAGG